MVPYNLPNGKTVYIKPEDLIDLTVEDIQDMMADDSGTFVQDPFHESSIDVRYKDDDDEDYEDFYDDKKRDD